MGPAEGKVGRGGDAAGAGGGGGWVGLLWGCGVCWGNGSAATGNRRRVHHLLPQNIMEKKKQGMVVLDDALGPAWSEALRAEIEHLAQLGGGCMKPNRTQFGSTEVSVGGVFLGGGLRMRARMDRRPTDQGRFVRPLFHTPQTQPKTTITQHKNKNRCTPSPSSPRPTSTTRASARACPRWPPCSSERT